MVRIHVTNKTKNIRELILARALSSTVIERFEDEIVDEEEPDINEILTDWFEKYE